MSPRRFSWRAGLLAAALAATVAALYVLVLEGGGGREADRLAAARLEEALGASRERLKAEILAELRSPAPPEGTAGPVAGSVLRRSETASDRALGQALASGGDRAFLAQRLAGVERQLDRAEGSRRRELEELRAELRRTERIQRKALGLLLAAVVLLEAYVLTARPPRPAG
jgi:hypothetical protein